MDKNLYFRLARQYGACYVYDECSLKDRLNACREIVGPSIFLCYSIKANPFLIPSVSPQVDLLEVCSPGELEICNECQIPSGQILYSGVAKRPEDIERALSLGVRKFTCESAAQTLLLNRIAIKSGLCLPVLLRLTAGSQFGMDESDLRSLIAQRSQLSGLSIEGIHFFSGTQQKKTERQIKELDRLSALLDALSAEYGYSARKIEYGTGMYIPYFQGEESEDTLAPLRDLAPALQALSTRCELTIEMGRFFVAPCGTYLTSVVDTKKNLGTNIAILDGGMHHVNYYGGSMGMRTPYLLHLTGDSSPGDVPTEEWMLCGSLCTTADVLVRNASLSGLAVGDVVAFLNAGAYSVTEAPALFLSRDMPAVLLVCTNGIHILRRAMPSWRLNCPNPSSINPD